MSAPDASRDVGTTGDDRTLAYYDANAADYDAWSNPGDHLRSERGSLTRFLAAMPAGGRALDLGCGAGHWAAAMIAAGFSVRALDASAGLVAQARARGVPAELGRFEDLAETAAYDGAWISFSLLHAPLADWPDVLARVARALRPGGALFLGVKEGEGEIRDRLGRRYSYIREPALRALLTGAGFARIEIETGRETGRDGSETGILLTHARLGEAR
ncbi:class I SAM-dependent DNA methyltransferase [Albimonas pacifica]|uniref:Methyltransferase domain-containing protein n=1 Tax=Albimonas pacifica TaxID=1114924 RepID=A0A1I3F347_9RHOB|nr:class I SAM-dependent methyltransferase [Albimonas pacifica]SFI05669.1 Methyltransferase domain-containing protein [Albimonas pacifica]